MSKGGRDEIIHVRASRHTKSRIAALSAKLSDWLHSYSEADIVEKAIREMHEKYVGTDVNTNT